MPGQDSSVPSARGENPPQASATLCAPAPASSEASLGPVPGSPPQDPVIQCLCLWHRGHWLHSEAVGDACAQGPPQTPGWDAEPPVPTGSQRHFLRVEV